MPILALFLAAAIVLTDQLIKVLVVYALKPVGTVTAIPHLLDLVYVENRGAAFGMMENMRWFFIIATSIVMLIFIYILVTKKVKSKLFITSAVLIIGGGVGNLIDRIVLGYVVDYLKLSFFPPVCNFADYCITIGTALLVIYILFFSDWMDKKEKKSEKKAVSPRGDGLE